MNYYEVLGLKKEPFSTSPDPTFLYLSASHKAALCRLQIAIRLKRGLSVILGDVGTGKTTLSRKLAQVFRDDEDVVFYMILNPYFRSRRQFLQYLARLFHIKIPSANPSGMALIEEIEKFLFRRGVEEGKTVVLLVDESQLAPDCIFEILRILLNYETNEYKILQLVLMGQMELLPRIIKMHNFWDRIALKCVLNPLDETELPRAIEFRLTLAGCHDVNKLFTNEAIELIYRQTQGYPRKFTVLCHNALESLIMHGKQTVDVDLIRELIKSDLEPMTANARDAAYA